VPPTVNPIFYALVIGAGASVAIQQVVNANLRAQLGSPWWAGLASYIGGTILMLVLALATGARLPALTSLRGPPIAWCGGIFGAIFVATGILMVPRLGAATTLALVVVGQMLGSLTIDHWGLLGTPQQPITPVRLAGAALLIAGVVLVRR
jgi:bacterial/archaeal transporter family-2 protein